MSGVFISYRREDTAGYAGRLYDALIAEFGRKRVFMDVDSIRAGENFVDVIDKWIASSSVVIVLIGKGWLNSGGVGSRRLDDPQDFVRLEVASALRQKTPVIPVLVGDATMPHADELPAPLTPLAQSNAIEIFDQLFHDSVKHLIDELRPFVPSTSPFRGWTKGSLGGLAIFVMILLGALAIAVFLSRVKKASPIPNYTQDLSIQEVKPDISDTLTGVDEASRPPIKVTTAPDISELPPVVEAAKTVTLPGNSSQVMGPRKPRILWRANVTVGDAWRIVGIASDGTVYIYDGENHVLDAVLDGKEQWAHSSPSSPTGFDAEGRLWLEDSSFNSRGEGGRVTTKGLVPDAARLRLPAAFRRSPYFCHEGKVSVFTRSKPPWSVDMDGNCGWQDPLIAPTTGTIYVSSDAGTLYAITPGGQVLWSAKQACKDTSYKVYPVSNDDLVVACRHEPLYALRGGKPLWTATLGASGGWSWGDVLSDASGNVYAGGEGPSLAYDLIALDTSGKKKWAVAAGIAEVPEPAAFDAQGRLYVVLRRSIVALSE